VRLPRAKLWSGIATSQGNVSSALAPSQGYREDQPEEGELQPSVISSIQSTILGLHGLLQAHVGNALGTPAGHPVPLDPTAGQATLAGVIARAQLQSMPSQVTPSPDSTMHSSAIDPALATSGPEDSSQSPLRPGSENPTETARTTSLSMYGLSDEQTKLLEEAIALAAAAAQAQAEAEAALEEEEDEEDEEGSDEDPES
jgi:hypothetical protein